MTPLVLIMRLQRMWGEVMRRAGARPHICFQAARALILGQALLLAGCLHLSFLSWAIAG